MVGVVEGSPAGRVTPATRRVAGPPRTLPGGRAVAGGLLVAAAAVGTFLVARGDDGPPSTRFAVVATRVPAGAPLSAGAVTLTPLELTPAIAERAVPAAALDQLDGFVAAVDLSPGELLQDAHLAPAGQPAGGYEVAVALGPEQALAGRVDAGSTVDVLATTGDCTTVLVPAARVASVERTGRDLGGARTVLVLRLPGPAEALAVVHAQEQGTLTLARPTTARTGDPAGAVPAPVCSGGPAT